MAQNGITVFIKLESAIFTLFPNAFTVALALESM
jgi:hypothetical protein